MVKPLPLKGPRPTIVLLVTMKLLWLPSLEMIRLFPQAMRKKVPKIPNSKLWTLLMVTQTTTKTTMISQM